VGLALEKNHSDTHEQDILEFTAISNHAFLDSVSSPETVSSEISDLLLFDS